MKAPKEDQEALKALLREWEAGAATGAFSSELTNKTMVAVLKALTREDKD